MTRPNQELSAIEREELFARRKKQVWGVVLVMTLASCLGSGLIIFLLWVVLQRITP